MMLTAPVTIKLESLLWDPDLVSSLTFLRLTSDPTLIAPEKTWTSSRSQPERAGLVHFYSVEEG